MVIVSFVVLSASFGISICHSWSSQLSAESVQHVISCEKQSHRGVVHRTEPLKYTPIWPNVGLCVGCNVGSGVGIGVGSAVGLVVGAIVTTVHEMSVVTSDTVSDSGAVKKAVIVMSSVTSASTTAAILRPPDILFAPAPPVV